MRIKGSVATGVLLALTLALIPTTAVSAENVTPASACKVLNQKVVSQNKAYTCTKSGKKLIWSKGVGVAKPTLDSTPDSTLASTLDSTSASISTSTPTAAPALETETPGPTCSRNKNSLKNC